MPTARRIPTYRVCQLARRHVTVALSGDGGDENFGGYRRYQMHLMEEKLRQPLPLALRRPVFGLLGRVYPKADWAPRVFRGKTTFQALARDSVEGYFHSMSILREICAARLYSSRFKAELGGYNAPRGLPSSRRKGRNRRPAVADPVHRPEDVSRGRHQYKGRSSEHGALAGGA